MLLPMMLLRNSRWASALTEPLEKTPSLLASLLAACHLNIISKAVLGYASAVLRYEVIGYCNSLLASTQLADAVAQLWEHQTHP